MGDSLHARLCAAGLLSAALAACGEPAPPPPPPPPEVRLLPVPPQQVGPQLTFKVEVSGCQQVAKVRVLDRELLLAEAAGTGPVTTLTAEAGKVDYAKRGMSAQLSVLAEAECDDGRSARSGQSPITYLPAAELHPGPWPFETFWLDAGGTSVLGCDRDVVRLDLTRAEKGRYAPPLPCQAGDSLQVGNGSIALLQPGRSAAVLEPSLTEKLRIDQPGIRELLVPPEGLVHTSSFDGSFFWLWAFDPSTRAKKWDKQVERPAAPILIDSANRVVYPTVKGSTPAGYSEVELHRFDRGDGRILGPISLGRIQWEHGPLPTAPLAAFSPDGTTAYLSDQERPESAVRACDISAAQDCVSGGGLKWQSKRLPGGVTTVLRYSKGLVALGPSVAYFLNAETGAVIGEAIHPTDPVVFAQASSGADGSLYLLGQLPGEARLKEQLVFDAPAHVAARLLVHGAGFTFDVDPSGRAWMLTDELVKLWSASEYAAAAK